MRIPVAKLDTDRGAGEGGGSGSVNGGASFAFVNQLPQFDH